MSVMTPVGTPWPIRNDGSKDVVTGVVVELSDPTVALVCVARELEVEIWGDAETVGVVFVALEDPVAVEDIDTRLIVDVEDPAKDDEAAVEPVPAIGLEDPEFEEEARLVGAVPDDGVAEGGAVLLDEAAAVDCGTEPEELDDEPNPGDDDPGLELVRIVVLVGARLHDPLGWHT
jgi:hypothetical protein